MKQALILVFVLCALNCQAQNAEKFNLDFEIQKAGDELPAGWFKWGDYALSTEAPGHSGGKAGKISSGESGNSFGSIAYRIPAHYEGSIIQLKGYMKTEEVEDGFAGLLLRVDGSEGPLVFDNMQKRQITGSNEWQEYTVTLNYPAEAIDILVAGLLVGRGTAWFDDFLLTIDGVDVQTLAAVEREPAKAELDRAFDAGSGIEIDELTPERVNNLALLGQVWGFLKYHHPEIGKGNLNWDYELFRLLPRYLEIDGSAARDELLVAWIEGLGALPPCVECGSPREDAFLEPDLQWIEERPEPLRKKLMDVYENRHQGEHYYVGLVPGIGNPVFRNENDYAEPTYPDDGFRLLALYRYWNMIRYFFPYRHLMDADWELRLGEYIPEFVNAKNELAYELAAVELIGTIQDTHANLWGGGDKIRARRGNNFPPFHVRFIEDELVVTDYYNPELKSRAGLEIGDVITAINGKPVERIVEETARYYPASNRPTQLRDMSANLLRSNFEEVSITYTRDQAETRTRLALYPRDSLAIYRWYRKSDERCYKLLEDNIGYVTLQSIKEEDIPVIKKMFKDTRGIIIDIRNYPSTFVPFKLGSYFVAAPTPFAKFTVGNPDHPGTFTFREGSEIPNAGETYRGKLIVIVNELTQSQAEYTSMAFRAGADTTIIGSTTAGADGNVSTIYLPGGLRTMISGIGVYYPDGTETQRIGIVPDLIVHPTIAGIRSGRDELLEKAVKLCKME